MEDGARYRPLVKPQKKFAGQYDKNDTGVDADNSVLNAGAGPIEYQFVDEDRHASFTRDTMVGRGGSVNR